MDDGSLIMSASSSEPKGRYTYEIEVSVVIQDSVEELFSIVFDYHLLVLDDPRDLQTDFKFKCKHDQEINNEKEMDSDFYKILSEMKIIL